MVKLHIIWTRTADLQFVGILDYWVKRNKSTAYSKKLVDQVTDTTKEIADNPMIYKATEYPAVRMASMGNFSIYYKVTEKEIIILAFWDNRQDPKKLLHVLEKGSG